MKTAGYALLPRLAALYGIQTSYSGSDHSRQAAHVESLLAVLRALGAPVDRIDDVPRAHADWISRQANVTAEPVLVAWDGRLEQIPLRLHRRSLQKQASLTLALEDGAESRWRCCPGESGATRPSTYGSDYVEVGLRFGRRLPHGYHRLTVECGKSISQTLVVSAPIKAYSPAGCQREWGVFIPLYSLHSNESWGVGDFSDMERLAQWVGGKGASALATLPLLASFLDSPHEASPYLPVSKLLWNELYVDVTRVPELAECEAARAIVDSPSFRSQIAGLRRARLVDYHRVMSLKRAVMEELSRHFFSADSPRRDRFDLFTKEHPEVLVYGRFRAAMERQKKPWREWPDRLRDGSVKSGDCDEAAVRYHQYVQWLADSQLKSVAESASYSGVGLYLDMPLGTHSDGFDTWRDRNLFAEGVSVGAPPDMVFTRGQNWTFPPLHPHRIRESGYQYFIACLRHHMRYANTLRIDHIMGLHRLFFIPQGMDSGRGVYVRYRPEEMYAVLSLESHRNECTVVGEDLGVVPPAVRTAMGRHRLRRMWVMHYELAGESRPVLPDPLPNQAASLNTHDMPPFASFWQGQDIADRVNAGIITARAERREMAMRARVKRRLLAFLVEKRLLSGRVAARSVLMACLSFVAGSPAPLALINLEDLWLETNAQNIPSTTTEHPNWQRKAKYSLEQFCHMGQIQSILGVVHRLRVQGANRRGSNRKTRKDR